MTTGSSAEGADRAQATIFSNVGLCDLDVRLSQLLGQAIDAGFENLGGGAQVLGHPELQFGIKDIRKTTSHILACKSVDVRASAAGA